MADDPTYTYDWPQIIADLEQGRYSRALCEEVQRAASSWPTCACGNLCDAIPRGVGKVPKNTVLFNKGVQFSGLINGLIQASLSGGPTHRKAANARRCLREIDNCVARILRKMKQRRSM